MQILQRLTIGTLIFLSMIAFASPFMEIFIERKMSSFILEIQAVNTFSSLVMSAKLFVLDALLFSLNYETIQAPSFGTVLAVTHFWGWFLLFFWRRILLWIFNFFQRWLWFQENRFSGFRRWPKTLKTFYIWTVLALVSQFRANFFGSTQNWWQSVQWSDLFFAIQAS